MSFLMNPVPPPPAIGFGALPPDTIAVYLLLGAAFGTPCFAVFCLWVKSMFGGRTKSVRPKRGHRHGRFGS